MKKFYILNLIIVVTGCTSWPKINIPGDDYYLSPFTPGEEISLPSTGKGAASSSVKKTPVSQ